MTTPVTAPDIARRPPATSATYAGDQTSYFEARIASLRPIGRHWPITAAHDAARHVTVVGFAPASPPGVLGDWDAIRARLQRRPDWKAVA